MIQSASYIEFNYVCRSLYVDISAFMEGSSRIAIFMNDILVKDLIIKSSDRNKLIKVFDSETLRYGSLKIMKLSEALKSSVIRINRIVVDSDGRIYPSEDKKVKVEFIGDSITCGYGVEDKNPENPYSVASQNALLAYPYLTAKEINADFQIVAYSGYGIMTGYGKVEKCITETVPFYYDKTAKLSDGTVFENWDFNRFSPDIIVINLGTNDCGYCSDEQKMTEFYNAYIEFLKTVRKINPHSEILCVIGIMETELTETIQSAVWNYSYDYKDEKIHFSMFETMKKEDGYGANYHPSVITHEKSAKELVRVMRKYYDEIYKLS